MGECIAEKGYDVRYGARRLKRVLAKSVLNPLSQLVLEGSVLEDDTVRVRTRGEAVSLSKASPDISWIGTNDGDIEDRNDIVILRNHHAVAADDDDDEFLLEDG